MELAVLIGLQASGKTTFYQRVLAETHVHVSKDNFPNARNRQRKQLRLIAEALAAGRNVAVDNTNPAPEQWHPLVERARTHRASVVGYWFPPDPTATLRRNATRPESSRVPEMGIHDTLGRLRRPHPSDGFDQLHTVRFDGNGGFDVRRWTETD
ncbi:ATP-binding protein [Actinopolyspora saharensis]|uniref:Predicted kinase n=1 Tax=Actinopolyspora saharensis TaxID=995062 RepID=A0A1H0Z656_9ACTN|nr:ATP-binding protein [Actinopolyspora saharensis]SDQ22874.1 Predicted kinase [Actinopolyspora saharensis]